MNCSTVSPADRMIERSVPRSNSLWSGMTTCENGWFRRRTKRLPDWRFCSKPVRSSALTHCCPETRGASHG